MSFVNTDAGGRKHFAAGDYLTRLPSGSPCALRIDCNFEKPGWTARTMSPVGNVVFPGSAILFEGQYYEIVHQDWQILSSKRICYYLNPWEPKFPIRTQFHYTPLECRKVLSQYHNRVKSNRLNLAITLFMPFVGMLPAPDQTRIANQYGISAVRITYLSSLLLFIPAGFGVVFSIVSKLGSPVPGPAFLHPYYPLGFYFIVECLIRMLVSAKLEEPMGSLPVAVPILLFRTLFQRPESPPVPRLAPKVDEVAPRTGLDYDLEVISDYPKEHWNPSVGIQYNGEWYGYLESKISKTAEKNRYHFFLKKAPENTWFRSVVTYTPGEAQEMYRRSRRLELGTWVDTFSIFWGLLNEVDQRKLAETFDFNAMKYTKWTILAIGALAISNLVACVANLLSGIGSPLDVFLLPVSGYFVIETLSRWNKLKNGSPSGSLFGVVVRPFAGRLLRDF